MLNKVLLPLIVLSLLVAACASLPPVVEATPASPVPEDPVVSTPQLPGTGSEEPAPGPYAPGKGDESMKRGEVYIDSQEILTLESFPPQFRLHVEGSLPTPCHELRAVVGEPNAQNQIPVEMYSLVDPNVECIQMLEAFEADISLGSYSSGSYTVFVNGEEAGQINP
jgi:hypothetical protein